MEEIDEDDDDDPCLILCEKKQKKDEQEDEDGEYDVDDYEDDRRRKLGFWRFFSFGTYNSCMWVSIQIFWRLLVSFGAALFVFFLATKPPTPNMSIKMVGIRQFWLGEGVDWSGVTTKILTCNCSMALVINNKSKLFGLHIHPSTIQMSFGPVVFASSQDLLRNNGKMLE
ncbi:hypothetical protein BVC80_9055g49 [Macleaya cordata]|uniref:Uncharacterized protein n=1 Tax=Macleaya cordata TaxID=56857 RepID=A0A200R9K6_MACCD|nr:hypothetical protein BVC80_9055g49 [Macleaya cordata]